MHDRYPLKQLEYPIVKHCNLKCVHCDHLSPLHSVEYVGIDTIITDIRRAASVLSPERFYLLGGEPTLHPNIGDVIVESAKHFKVALVSNGLRIFDIPDKTLRLLSSIDISMYPELTTDYDNIHNRLLSIFKDKNCKIRMRSKEQFYKGWADSPLDDKEMLEIYQSCLIAHKWKCYSLYEGMFYKCSRIHVANKHARKIGYDKTDFRDDGLNIHADDFLSHLPKYLDSEHLLGVCRICLGTPQNLNPHLQHRHSYKIKS